MMRSVIGPKSPKNKTTLLILTVLLGTLGADRFYLGKIGTGVLKCLTLGGLGFWYVYDLTLTCLDSQTDSDGLYVRS